MKKRIILLFLFISSCGYTPINSLNNKDYSIISFKLNGNNQINRIIKKNFDRYQNRSNEKNQFNINLESQIIKNTNSKSQSGDNSNLSIQILIDLEIIKDEISIKKISYSETTSYNSLGNKFELKQYENILINDLTDKILNKVHFNLSNIK